MYYSNGNYEAFARPRKPAGVNEKSAYLVEGGQMAGDRITILEASSMDGGALDGTVDALTGWLIRRAVLMPAFFATAMLLLAYPITAAANDIMLDDSRALVQRFGSQLQTALKKAMAEGGPTQALTVCKDRAPQIAAELSRESGAKVSRTSDRFRNPANAPEMWQAEILTDFEISMSDENPTPEYFEQQSDGSARFMKAISMQPLCLVCHGTKISDDVSAMLNDLYPHDRATTYSLNDLRGAFSVTWPTPDSTMTER